MRIKRNFPIYPLLLSGIFFVFASSCKKESEDPKIPILSTVEVTKIGQVTAQSGGIITSDAGFAVIVRGVCQNTSGNPSIADNKTIDGSGDGNYPSELTGLTIGTTYYLSAYATNSQGTAYGGTMIFETLGSTFTDLRDGNVYKIVTIGDKIRMAENLKYLPSVVGPGTGSPYTPYYYVYNYDGTKVIHAKATANYSNYGVLYNWPAALNSCPIGWHLPSDAEWKELTDYLGGVNVAGGKLKEIGITHWKYPNFGATNETGFTALPGGMRSSVGNFYDVVFYGNWWGATEGSTNYPWVRTMDYFSEYVFRNSGNEGNGYSVRCLRD